MYDAATDETGTIFVSRNGADILRLPVVATHADVTVCEFARIEPALDVPTILALIRGTVLEQHCADRHRNPVLELVDLDAGRWSRGPYGIDAAALHWIDAASEPPPGLDARATGLPRATPAPLATTRTIEGFRTAWAAACAAPDRRVATAHGAKGTVWITRLADGAVERLPPIGTAVHALAWGDALLAIPIKVPHFYAWNGSAWQQHDLGTGAKLAAAWSPDGREVAFPCLDGQLRIYDWATQRCRLAFAPTGEAIYDAHWSHDGQRIFVGHKTPMITTHRADTGERLREVRGTQHFQQRFLVGPDDTLAASLVKRSISLVDADGRVRHELANPSTFGLRSGAFARGGRLLVTECKDGLLRIWRVRDGALLATHASGPDPVVVLDDAVVVRDAAAKQLLGLALPA